MKVDAYIVNAIDQYILANKLTQAAFAKQLGISEATMVKWRRQGNGITGRRWQTLYRYIKRYLPAERIYIAGNGEENYSSATEGTGVRAYFDPKYVPQMVPVLVDENLRQYQQMLQSVEQFVAGREFPRVEYRPHCKATSGIFCYVLPHTEVGVPQGARLFVSSDEKPRSGFLVLAVTAKGKIMLANYTTSGNTFTLAGRENITGKLAQAREMLTMLATVVMYEVYTI